jgi:hypothetical protein
MSNKLTEDTDQAVNHNGVNNVKSEIDKYLDFVFQDFPETEEVLTEKKRILAYMEDIHRRKLSDGESKLDAMEAALDAVGDIRELNRKFGRKKTRGYTF